MTKRTNGAGLIVISLIALIVIIAGGISIINYSGKPVPCSNCFSTPVPTATVNCITADCITPTSTISLIPTDVPTILPPLPTIVMTIPVPTDVPTLPVPIPTDIPTAPIPVPTK